MNENRPAVSVVMTTYNAEKYVGEAIESILNQSFKNWELVIVDDGSTDSTKSIVGIYQDPRIRFELGGRRGRARALNEAVSLARGEWVANLDADDQSLPHRLEMEFNFLRNNKGYGLVGTAKPIVMDMQGKIVDIQTRPTDDSDLKKALKTYNPFFHSAVMFSKEAWKSLGGYDENIPCLIDYEFWIRIASRYRVRNLEDPMSKKRDHSEQYFKGRVYGTSDYMKARAFVLQTYYRYIENDILLLIKAFFYKIPLVPIIYDCYIRHMLKLLNMRQLRH